MPGRLRHPLRCDLVVGQPAGSAHRYTCNARQHVRPCDIRPSVAVCIAAVQACCRHCYWTLGAHTPFSQQEVPLLDWFELRCAESEQRGGTASCSGREAAGRAGRDATGRGVRVFRGEHIMNLLQSVGDGYNQSLVTLDILSAGGCWQNYTASQPCRLHPAKGQCISDVGTFMRALSLSRPLWPRFRFDHQVLTLTSPSS